MARFGAENINKTKLAEALGVSKGYISKMFSDKYTH